MKHRDYDLFMTQYQLAFKTVRIFLERPLAHDHKPVFFAMAVGVVVLVGLLMTLIGWRLLEAKVVNRQFLYFLDSTLCEASCSFLFISCIQAQLS
jgi:hypothetical protein